MIIEHYDTYLIENCRKLEDLYEVTHEYDLFISGYNKEDMVRQVFSKIRADKKIWLLFPDYNLTKDDIEEGTEYIFSISLEMTDPKLEMNYINSFLDAYNLIKDYKDKKIAIDITGFVKPYMFYLILVLKNHFSKIDIIYTEPTYYTNQEDTGFSDDSATTVRSINGYDSRSEHSPDDLLLINAGYDYPLISRIAENKKRVKNNKILIGFPSLQPIMYQENILNFKKVAGDLSIHATNFDPLFAPANDPFQTAKVINEYVNEYVSKHPKINTIYLVPIGTKAQALGMQLFSFYEKERLKDREIEIKMIYPFTMGYANDSGKNLFRINKYTLEF